jgi:asparaginyl-tRNA synthetase
VVRRVLAYARHEIECLGGKPEELAAMRRPFPRIEYGDAVEALIQTGLKPPVDTLDGWDFGMREERVLISLYGGTPAFLLHHPARIKYFNMQRRAGAAMSVDLLTPPIGETSGGGERESDADLTERQLHESRMLETIRIRGGSEDEFSWYLHLLRDPGLPPRAGFGLGFERLVAFLLGTDDIVSCLAFPSTDTHLFP